MDYIKRHMETHILQADQTFKGLLVTGARQVGKSTLLRHVFPERSYLTFDDPILLTQARTEPGLFFRNHPYPITLDEVQHIQELFPYIKMACDASDDKGLFSLTGSQSFRLMQHVSESLAGRIAIFELSGLSMREIDGTDFASPSSRVKRTSRSVAGAPRSTRISGSSSIAVVILLSMRRMWIGSCFIHRMCRRI